LKYFWFLCRYSLIVALNTEKTAKMFRNAFSLYDSRSATGKNKAVKKTKNLLLSETHV